MVERMSERDAIVACIDPDAYGTGTYAGDVIDMLYFERVIFCVLVGDLGNVATIDFAVQESILTGGAFAAMSPVKAITQLTQAGSDDNKQVVVEVKADELTPGYRFLRGVLTVGGANSDASMVALADTARWKPASNWDLASVDEIVA